MRNCAREPLLQRAPTWHWDLARKKPFTTGHENYPLKNWNRRVGKSIQATQPTTVIPLPTAASYGSTPTATTWTSTNARNLRLSRHLLSAPSRQQASLWRRRSSTPCSSCPSAFWLSLLSPPGGRA